MFVFQHQLHRELRFTAFIKRVRAGLLSTHIKTDMEPAPRELETGSLPARRLFLLDRIRSVSDGIIARNHLFIDTVIKKDIESIRSDLMLSISHE